MKVLYYLANDDDIDERVEEIMPHAIEGYYKKLVVPVGVKKLYKRAIDFTSCEIVDFTGGLNEIEEGTFDYLSGYKRLKFEVRINSLLADLKDAKSLEELRKLARQLFVNIKIKAPTPSANYESGYLTKAMTIYEKLQRGSDVMPVSLREFLNEWDGKELDINAITIKNLYSDTKGTQLSYKLPNNEPKILIVLEDCQLVKRLLTKLKLIKMKKDDC